MPTSEVMSNRFEKWSFTPDLCIPWASAKLWIPHQEHRERIQNKLKEFLSAQEARETAARVHNLALDIDDEIGKILKDPLVRRLYEYDGQFFTPEAPGSFTPRSTASISCNG